MLPLLKDNNFIYKTYEDNEIIGIDQVIPRRPTRIYKYSHNLFVSDYYVKEDIISTSVSSTMYTIEALNYPTVIEFNSTGIDIKFICVDLKIGGSGGPFEGFSTMPVIVPAGLSTDVKIFNQRNANNINVNIVRYTI